MTLTSVLKTLSITPKISKLIAKITINLWNEPNLHTMASPMVTSLFYSISLLHECLQAWPFQIIFQMCPSKFFHWKTSYKETCGELSPFLDDVLYYLPSLVFFKSFSMTIKPPRYAYLYHGVQYNNSGIWAVYIIKKVGRKVKSKFGPIPQISSFSSMSLRSANHFQRFKFLAKLN